jgi:hypothetical protein
MYRYGNVKSRPACCPGWKCRARLLSDRGPSDMHDVFCGKNPSKNKRDVSHSSQLQLTPLCCSLTGTFWWVRVINHQLELLRLAVQVQQSSCHHLLHEKSPAPVVALLVGMVLFLLFLLLHLLLCSTRSFRHFLSSWATA